MSLAAFALACTIVAWAMVFLRVDRRVALVLFVLLSLIGAGFVVIGGMGFAWDTPPPEGPQRTLLLHGALILAAQLVGFMRLGARSSRGEGAAPTTRM